MSTRPIRIRRARRTDFSGVMRLLAASGTAVPPPDRSTLRRFRQLVADLGGDFYLATIDERIVGVAHVTYERRLVSAPRATLATLVVGATERSQGIGTILFHFAAARARRRACACLQCPVRSEDTTATARFLERVGARSAGSLFELALDGNG
ncbi:MAG TPA: GNAT family N-acetyltransferase [Candidatus Binatia bacterium]|nr:GNAT family N-acetyltransferase [Candidatus Binatia bacterium]